MEGTHNKSTKMVTKSQLCHNWIGENCSPLLFKAIGQLQEERDEKLYQAIGSGV
jgi:hypothetical protein